MHLRKRKFTLIHTVHKVVRVSFSVSCAHTDMQDFSLQRWKVHFWSVVLPDMHIFSPTEHGLSDTSPLQPVEDKCIIENKKFWPILTFSPSQSSHKKRREMSRSRAVFRRRIQQSVRGQIVLISLQKRIQERSRKRSLSHPTHRPLVEFLHVPWLL